MSGPTNRVNQVAPWLFLWLLLAACLPALRAQDRTVGDVVPSEQTAFSPLTKQAEALWGEGKFKAARKTFELVEQRSLSSRERAHAILAQGDCLLREGNEYKAFQKYKKAVDNYSSFIPMQRVLESEKRIADKYFAGNFGRFLFFHYSTRDKAVEVYTAITKAAPYGPLAATCLNLAAQQLWDDKEYQQSVDKYAELVTKYPDYEHAADARLEYVHELLQYAAISDGDGLLIAKANTELDKFLKLYPTHARADEARALRAEAREIEAKRLVYLGEFYQRHDSTRLPAASRYLGRVIKDFHDTKAAPEAEAQKALVDAKLAAANQPIPGVDAPEGESGEGTTTTGTGTPGAPGFKPGVPILEGTRNSDKWLLPIPDLHPPKEGQ